MKVKNQDLLNFANTVLGDKHLPVRISYAIHKNAAAIEPYLKAYDEVRKKLIDQYAKKDDDGKPVVEDGKYTIENVEAFNADIAELNAEETEIEVHKVSISEFEKLDDPKFDALTVSEMAILHFMIEE